MDQLHLHRWIESITPKCTKVNFPCKNEIMKKWRLTISLSWKKTVNLATHLFPHSPRKETLPNSILVLLVSWGFSSPETFTFNSEVFDEWVSAVWWEIIPVSFNIFRKPPTTLNSPNCHSIAQVFSPQPIAFALHIILCSHPISSHPQSHRNPNWHLW